MRIVTLSLFSAVVVSGCSVADVRGKAPMTPDECETNWLQERGVLAPEVVEAETKAEDAFATFFVRLAAAFSDPKLANDRYTNCLTRVGVTDLNAFLATDSDVAASLGVTAPPPAPYLAQRRPAHCPAGASVLYGGSGYCVGR